MWEIKGFKWNVSIKFVVNIGNVAVSCSGLFNSGLQQKCFQKMHFM